MERKLATIAIVESLHPIEDADKIELAKVRGWQVVTKKGEFKPGDWCVFFEIDSVLPEWPEFEFLRKSKYRVKTIRLRGVLSQGLAMPIQILERIGDFMPVVGEDDFEGMLKLHDENKAIPIVEGEDLTEEIGVRKYEPPVPANLGGESKGKFPHHSRKTDEERLQNLVKKYDRLRLDEDGNPRKYTVTEKLDGSSTTYYLYEGQFGVASRNLEKKETENNSMWKFAREIDLEGRMRSLLDKKDLDALTLQGEIIGEGIQKNKYGLRGQEVRFFRAWFPNLQRFATTGEFMEVASLLGVETVPVLDVEFELPEDPDDLLTYADGESKIAPGTLREGVVLSTEGNVNDYGRKSFKVISNEFLEKYGG